MTTSTKHEYPHEPNIFKKTWNQRITTLRTYTILKSFLRLGSEDDVLYNRGISNAVENVFVSNWGHKSFYEQDKTHKSKIMREADSFVNLISLNIFKKTLLSHLACLLRKSLLILVHNNKKETKERVRAVSEEQQQRENVPRSFINICSYGVRGATAFIKIK